MHKVCVCVCECTCAKTSLWPGFGGGLEVVGVNVARVDWRRTYPSLFSTHLVPSSSSLGVTSRLCCGSSQVGVYSALESPALSACFMTRRG